MHCLNKFFTYDSPRFAADLFFARSLAIFARGQRYFSYGSARCGIFYDNNRREGSHGKSRTGNEREIRR